MEDITKQQFVLICLLVAIVTAVATSVATVSLTNEGSTPQQTIYKVIEQSIQKVADLPVVTTKTETAPVVTKGSTILSPADIAAKVAPSVIRIYKKDEAGRRFVALGVVTGNKGGVIASMPLLPLLDSHGYVAVTNDNREISATFQKSEIEGTFSFFTLNYVGGEKNKVPSYDISNIFSLKLGSNVIALGGKEGGDVVSSGIVTELRGGSEAASTTKNIIVTDMVLSSSFSGFLLFDTGGNLVAFEKGIDDMDKQPYFMNAATIKAALAGSI